jgi:hypothetical protein
MAATDSSESVGRRAAGPDFVFRTDEDTTAGTAGLICLRP